jgi:hypothetical protein
MVERIGEHRCQRIAIGGAPFPQQQAIGLDGVR